MVVGDVLQTRRRYLLDISADTLLLGVSWYVVFLFSLTFHEAAHAWAALRLGDSTAYLGGQVTLDPIPHMRREPFGTILVPLISYALGGWMMGWASAPYDPVWAERHPRRASLMAVAGPVANLLIAIAAGLAIRVGLSTGYLALPGPGGFPFHGLVLGAEAGTAAGVAAVLSILFSLNVLLLFFNLIPLPPLDGSSVIQLFMSERLARQYRELLYQPMVSLLGLLVAWKLFGVVFWPIFGIVLQILFVGS